MGAGAEQTLRVAPLAVVPVHGPSVLAGPLGRRVTLGAAFVRRYSQPLTLLEVALGVLTVGGFADRNVTEAHTLLAGVWLPRCFIRKQGALIEASSVCLLRNSAKSKESHKNYPLNCKVHGVARYLGYEILPPRRS